MILYYLYNRYKLITFIINYIFFIIFNLTRLLYIDFESIYRISIIINFSIISNIVFITTLILNL